MNPAQSLSQIAQETAACTLCSLQHSRKNAVPGEGPADAEIMFIGEGPGFHENENGRPFVGAAGTFLEELLASIGLVREEVFISNVVNAARLGIGTQKLRNYRLVAAILTVKFRPLTRN